VQTNPTDDPSLGEASANIVRGDAADTTTLYISVEPPVATTVQLSADFGSVDPPSAQTDASGKATATYISWGATPTDATTTIGKISATVGEENYPDLAEVYNLAGFPGFDFREAQVPDARFTAHTEWGVSDIQTFFVDRNSFFAKFYLVGSQGDRGFLDVNENTTYDAGEPKYCGDPEVPDCSMNGPKTSAAQAFVNAAKKQAQRVNPKLLLVQAQKEHSLISSAALPSRDHLNRAFECGTSATFGAQLNCAADTMADHFSGAPSMPFFFSLVFLPSDFLRHWVDAPQGGVSEPRPVAFTNNTKGTYSLYRYTPWVAAEPGGGGNYLFEQLWKQYSSQHPNW